VCARANAPLHPYVRAFVRTHVQFLCLCVSQALTPPPPPFFSAALVGLPSSLCIIQLDNTRIALNMEAERALRSHSNQSSESCEVAQHPQQRLTHAPLNLHQPTHHAPTYSHSLTLARERTCVRVRTYTRTHAHKQVKHKSLLNANTRIHTHTHTHAHTHTHTHTHSHTHTHTHTRTHTHTHTHTLTHTHTHTHTATDSPRSGQR